VTWKFNTREDGTIDYENGTVTQGDKTVTFNNMEHVMIRKGRCRQRTLANTCGSETAQC